MDRVSEHTLTEGQPDPSVVDQAVQEQGEHVEESTSPEDEEKVLAGERGWVDEDRWTGKGKWVDARTFNRIYETRTVPKQLRTEIGALQARLLAQDAEIAELRKGQQQQAEVRQRIHADTLQAELAAAHENQDWKRVAEIQSEMLESKVQAAAPK